MHGGLPMVADDTRSLRLLITQWAPLVPGPVAARVRRKPPGKHILCVRASGTADAMISQEQRERLALDRTAH